MTKTTNKNKTMKENKINSWFLNFIIEQATIIHNKNKEAKEEIPKKEKPARVVAIEEFFNKNPRAFDCKRKEVIDLVRAITGLDIEVKTKEDTHYLPQFTVAARKSNNEVIICLGYLVGYCYNPLKEKDYIQVTIEDSRPPTDEEFAAFIEKLKPQTKELYFWINNRVGWGNIVPND